MILQKIGERLFMFNKRFTHILLIASACSALACEIKISTGDVDGGDWWSGDTEEEADTQTDGDAGSSGDSGAGRENDLCGSPDAACSPGQSVPCTELGDEYGGNASAYCKDDCSGWIADGCENVEPADIYGTLSVFLAADYILDSTRLGDDEYLTSHEETIISNEPVFVGTMAGIELPKAAVRDYEIWVIRSSDDQGPIITAVQQAFDENEQLVNPVMELRMSRDDFETGVQAGICLSQGVAVYVYDLKPDFSGIECFHGVSGDAVMNVELAEGLTESEGGQLVTSAIDVPIYYIKETPHGDLSGSLSQPACEKLTK